MLYSGTKMSVNVKHAAVVSLVPVGHLLEACRVAHIWGAVGFRGG